MIRQSGDFAKLGYLETLKDLGPVEHWTRQNTMSTIDSLAIHFLRHGQWSEAVQLYRDELACLLPKQRERSMDWRASMRSMSHDDCCCGSGLLGGFSIILFSLFLSNYNA